MLFLSVFKTLNNRRVVVELKSGVRLGGILDTVDQYHNIKLKNVEPEDPIAYPHLSNLEQLFIRGSSINAISLPPEHVDIDLLQDSCRHANTFSS